MGCGSSAGKAGEQGAVVAEGTAGQQSMEMYFQELKKFTDIEMKDLLEVEKAKATDDAKAISLKQMEMKANRGAFKVTANRLLKECFEAGDVSGDGFLSKEESAKVFATIVDEKGDFLTIMAKEEQRRVLAQELGLSKKMFEVYDVEDEEKVKKRLEDEKKADAKRSAEQIDKDMTAALANYRAQKKSRDTAAFAILDKTGDGRVNKKEFTDAFDTTTETYEAFLTALGLCDAPKA